MNAHTHTLYKQVLVHDQLLTMLSLGTVIRLLMVVGSEDQNLLLCQAAEEVTGKGLDPVNPFKCTPRGLNISY